MNSSVQYAALARLLSHNNRVHDLEDMLNRMPVSPAMISAVDSAEEVEVNPFADLQNEMDREVRTSLVHCWLAMPADPYED
jgi:hypothetical protein